MSQDHTASLFLIVMTRVVGPTRVRAATVMAAPTGSRVLVLLAPAADLTDKSLGVHCWLMLVPNRTRALRTRSATAP